MSVYMLDMMDQFLHFLIASYIDSDLLYIQPYNLCDKNDDTILFLWNKQSCLQLQSFQNR